jgi:hypothetical protein
MNLSPVEAINRVNESVTVEMLVQRTKCCTGSRQVFLDSEANHRDPKNLGVVITKAGRAKVSEAAAGSSAKAPLRGGRGRCVPGGKKRLVRWGEDETMAETAGRRR